MFYFINENVTSSYVSIPLLTQWFTLSCIEAGLEVKTCSKPAKVWLSWQLSGSELLFVSGESLKIKELAR